MGSMSQGDNLELSPALHLLLLAIADAVTKAAAAGREPADRPLWHLDVTAQALSQAATTAVAGTGVQCLLWSPPTTIITSIDARTGNLRLECLHPQPHQHCWDLNGIRTSC